LAVVVVWLSKDAWAAIVDTFLFPATKALSDPSGATIHDGMATEAKHRKMMVIVVLCDPGDAVRCPDAFDPPIHSIRSHMETDPDNQDKRTEGNEPSHE
jgi:hypothetical protein